MLKIMTGMEKDIWTNKKDIFASIANFLKKANWKKINQLVSLLIKGCKENV